MAVTSPTPCAGCTALSPTLKSGDGACGICGMAPGGPGGSGRPEGRFERGPECLAEGGGLGGTECLAERGGLGGTECRASGGALERGTAGSCRVPAAALEGAGAGGVDGEATTLAGGGVTGATVAGRAGALSARFPLGLAREAEATEARAPTDRGEVTELVRTVGGICLACAEVCAPRKRSEPGSATTSERPPSTTAERISPGDPQARESPVLRAYPYQVLLADGERCFRVGYPHPVDLDSSLLDQPPCFAGRNHQVRLPQRPR